MGFLEREPQRAKILRYLRLFAFGGRRFRRLMNSTLITSVGTKRFTQKCKRIDPLRVVLLCSVSKGGFFGFWVKRTLTGRVFNRDAQARSHQLSCLSPAAVSKQSGGPRGTAESSGGVLCLSRFAWLHAKSVRVSSPYFANPSRRFLEETHAVDKGVRISPLRVWCFSVPFRKEVFWVFRKRTQRAEYSIAAK